ncbi:MAG: twin-arginine translocase TatA/TatE family subunit [Bacillota bacterium]
MFGLMPTIGPWELVLILAVVLVIFGPGKLPGVGKAIGSTIKEFRKASGENHHEPPASLVSKENSKGEIDNKAG